MKVTKQQILEKFSTSKNLTEIVDGDNIIIGDKDVPEISPDQESRANRTTDYNVKVHGQNFKNDFLGRFGFYFYESENAEKPKVLDAIAGVVGEENANAVMEAIKPHLEDVLDQMGDGLVNEGKVVEDKVNAKKDDKSISDQKKTEEISPDKLKKLDNIFSKIPKNQINKLIQLLEKYK